MRETEIVKEVVKKLQKLGYDMIEQEVPIRMGTRQSLADIVVYQRAPNKRVPYIVIEVKKDLEGGWLQASSYAFSIGAPYAIVTNGKEYDIYDVRDGLNNIKQINDFPPAESESKKDSDKIYWMINERLRGPYSSRERFDTILLLNIIARWIKTTKPNMANYNYISNIPISEYTEWINNALRNSYVHDFKINYNINFNSNIIKESLGELVESDASFGEFLEKYLEKEQRREVGEFYTPKHIIQFMVDMIKNIKPESILDPCCGVGHLLRECARLNKDAQFYGHDINSLTSLIAHTYLTEEGLNIKITTEDSLGPNSSLWSAPDKYDLVVCNPPFGGNIKDNLEWKFDFKVRRIDEAFLLLAQYVVKPGGTICTIVPEGMLFSHSGKQVRQFIQNNCRIKGIVSLPMGMFLPYTHIKSSLILLEKWTGGAPAEPYKIFMGAVNEFNEDIQKELTTVANDYHKWRSANE